MTQAVSVYMRKRVMEKLNFICDGRRVAVYSSYVFQEDFFEIRSPDLQKHSLKSLKITNQDIGGEEEAVFLSKQTF